MIRTPSLYLALLYLLPGFSQAADIEAKLPNGLLAQAEYSAGAADKPAILLLHGFLTVHTFNLIFNIHSELADNHYSVLSPTLTLGINKRRTSLDCNALHLHDMESDQKEIDWWVNWLIKKGHKHIILVGHSSGAVQMAQYASIQQHKEVIKLIALSLIPLGKSNNVSLQASTRLANKMIAEKNESIGTFSLAYCIESYNAPAKKFLSYAQWDDKRILNVLQQISITKEIIMGSNDVPVTPDWISNLKNTGATVHVITGADHFFGASTEFALYDTILAALSKK